MDLDNFNVLIGENNTGKSSFFAAIELFLGTSARGVDEDIFYNRDVRNNIILTGRFSDLTQKEMEKLAPWAVDDTLTVTKEYQFDQGRVTVSYFALMKVPDNEWLDDDFECYNERKIVDGLPIREFLPSGRISRQLYSEAVKKYLEKYKDVIAFRVDKRENPAGFKGVLDGRLPRFFLVPAIKDITEETKANQSTLLGKLMGWVIKRFADNNPHFHELEEAISKLVRVIEGETPEKKIEEFREIEKQLKEALADWDVGISIHVDGPDLDTLVQMGTRITVDDGFETTAEHKGNGLQRSLIFALMRVWADNTRKSHSEGDEADIEVSSIFAFEEPELFLHPQICRATYTALKKLSQYYQMMLCTHSANFINLDDYKSIICIRKENPTNGTRANRVHGDLFEANGDEKKRFGMIQYFNPDRSEVFFARKVVLVEGATEKALLPLLAERLRKFDYRVSFIDCGGKFNLRLFMKVLNAFKIRYLAIHDEDPIPADLLPGSEKYHTAKRLFDENERIGRECEGTISRSYRFTGQIEDAIGVNKSHAEKVGKPYAAVEVFSDPKKEIPSDLTSLITMIYDG